MITEPVMQSESTIGTQGLNADQINMTPKELSSFLQKRNIPPSALAHALSLNRASLNSFLNGDLLALPVEDLIKIHNACVSHDMQNLKEAGEYGAMVDAISGRVSRHSVHYHYEDQRERQTASGTLVQILDRMFIATARHTIPKTTQFLEFTGGHPTEVQILRNERTGEKSWRSPTMVGIKKAEHHRELDIGYIEVSSDADRALDRQAAVLDDLYIGRIQYGRNAYLFGYPHSFERGVRSHARIRYVILGTLIYPSPVLAPDEWPSIAVGDRVPDENIDIFLHYDQELSGALVPVAGGDSSMPLDMGSKLPPVHGMSGGGLWQSVDAIRDADLWTTTGYKLCGIQSRWHREKCYLRATQIIHWLKLVQRDYSDLSTAIQQHIDQHM